MRCAWWLPLKSFLPQPSLRLITAGEKSDTFTDRLGLLMRGHLEGVPMFESPTLSVSELAERWQKTPRQILDYAQALGVPLYFMFDGLSFDVFDYWHRANGDADQRNKLDLLRESITHRESWISRSVRDENGEWEQQLTAEEIQMLRIEIETDKKKCGQIMELLETREISRKTMQHRGLMRATPKTLFDITQCGEARFTPKAFHPGTPVQVTVIPEQVTPIVEGRLMSLEPYKALPPLTIDSLCAITTEVKVIEAYLQAKQKPTPPASLAADSTSNAQKKKWTPEKLAELEAYRAAHTMPETAQKFGISEQRIRVLLPRDKPKSNGYSAFTHRMHHKQ